MSPAAPELDGRRRAIKELVDRHRVEFDELVAHFANKPVASRQPKTKDVVTESDAERDRRLQTLADAVLRKRHWDEYAEILDHCRKRDREMRYHL